MYNVQLDENLFFTGNYAKVGSVKNGVSVDKLPPSNNALCYKLVDVEVTTEHEEPVLQYMMDTIDESGEMTTVELTKEEFAALTDDEKTNVIVSYKTDEEGNVVYETVVDTEIVKDWKFSQEKYDELEAAKAEAEEEAKANAEYQESISNETLKAENAALLEQIDMLTMCVIEMSEMVYA